MTTGLVDWTVRMVMLVLAGLVTLSILGSLAAVSNDIRLRIGDERPAAGTAAQDPAPPASAPEDRAPGNAAADGASEAGGPSGAGEVSAVEAAAPPVSPAERWLEAIAYALLAIAGLLALAIVLIGRSLRHLRRIADALESQPRGG